MIHLLCVNLKQTGIAVIQALFLKIRIKEHVTQGTFVYISYIFIFQVHKLHLAFKKSRKVKNTRENTNATFNLYLPVKGFIEELPLHLAHDSILYLQSDPKGIDAHSPIGQCRSLVPDVRQMFLPGKQVGEWIGQRALVLVTAHYEVIHDKRCKHEQEKDACQGKPVHLPVIQHRALFSQLSVRTWV